MSVSANEEFSLRNEFFDEFFVFFVEHFSGPGIEGTAQFIDYFLLDGVVVFVEMKFFQVFDICFVFD